MKFEVNTGNKFELKIEIKKEETHSIKNIFLTIFIMGYIFIASAAIYGARTSDYTIFNTVSQTLNKGIETIGMFSGTAEHQDTS